MSGTITPERRPQPVLLADSPTDNPANAARSHWDAPAAPARFSAPHQGSAGSQGARLTIDRIHPQRGRLVMEAVTMITFAI
ncbi:hypothetical protein GCM10027589_11150 [Actinocorallia lasiicapitis]